MAAAAEPSVGEHAHAFADAREVVNGQLHLRRVRDGEQVHGQLAATWFNSRRARARRGRWAKLFKFNSRENSLRTWLKFPIKTRASAQSNLLNGQSPALRFVRQASNVLP